MQTPESKTGTGTTTGTATVVNWETLTRKQFGSEIFLDIWDSVSCIISILDTIRTLSNWETDLKKVSETFAVIPGSLRPWLQVERLIT